MHRPKAASPCVRSVMCLAARLRPNITSPRSPLRSHLLHPIVQSRREYFGNKVVAHAPVSPQADLWLRIPSLGAEVAFSAAAMARRAPGPKPKLATSSAARGTLVPKLESNAECVASAHGAAVLGGGAIVPRPSLREPESALIESRAA
jgi:hypothetical protein